MKKTLSIVLTLFAVMLLISAVCVPAFAAGETAETLAAAENENAAESTADSTVNVKAKTAAILVAVVAGIGAAAMSFAIVSASNGISRQPEAAGNIRTNVMLGLVFIETAIIYALIVAILIIFVL